MSTHHKFKAFKNPALVFESYLCKIYAPSLPKASIGNILVTKPQEVLVLRWKWNKEQEEYKRFYIHPLISSIYITNHDEQLLAAFDCSPFNQLLISKDNSSPHTYRILPEVMEIYMSLRSRIKGRNPSVSVAFLPYSDFASNHYGHFFIEEMPALYYAAQINIPLLVNRSILPAHSELLKLAKLKYILKAIAFLLSTHTLKPSSFKRATYLQLSLMSVIFAPLHL
jgi:hypothetical protein